MTAHAKCLHPATPAARARCRKLASVFMPTAEELALAQRDLDREACLLDAYNDLRKG